MTDPPDAFIIVIASARFNILDLSYKLPSSVRADASTRPSILIGSQARFRAFVSVHRKGGVSVSTRRPLALPVRVAATGRGARSGSDLFQRASYSLSTTPLQRCTFFI